MRVYVCTCVHVCVYIHVCVSVVYVCTCVCVSVVYVCTCVCVHIGVCVVVHSAYHRWCGIMRQSIFIHIMFMGMAQKDLHLSSANFNLEIF